MSALDERIRLGQAICDLCSGCEFELSLLAQVDAMASAVGAVLFMHGNTLAEAEAVLAEMHEKALQHVRANWGSIEARDVGGKH